MCFRTSPLRGTNLCRAFYRLNQASPRCISSVVRRVNVVPYTKPPSIPRKLLTSQGLGWKKGVILIKNVNTADMMSVLDKIRSRTPPPRKDAKLSSVMLLSKGLVNWLNDDTFLEAAVLRLVHDQHWDQPPDSVELNVLFAIVDRIPAASPLYENEVATTPHWFASQLGRQTTAPVDDRGYEGLAYTLAWCDAFVPHKSEHAQVSESERFGSSAYPATLSFSMYPPRQRDEGKEANTVVTLPLANTVFSNNRAATMFTTQWKYSPKTKSLKLVAKVDLNHATVQLPLVHKLASTNGPLGTQFERLLAVSTPLVPLTQPLRVLDAMGNIIRTVAAADKVDAEPAPASRDLERAVASYFVKHDIDAQAVSIWALVIPGRSRLKQSTIDSRKVSGRIAFIKKCITEYIDAPPADASAAWAKTAKSLNKLLWSGASIHRVQSGGGGWGKKTGLLSLDPGIEFKREEEKSLDFDFDNDDMELPSFSGLKTAASPGDYVAFFVQPPEGVKLPIPVRAMSKDMKHRLESLDFGVIPNTGDDMFSDAEPTVADASVGHNINIYRNHFGALSETGMALEYANNISNKMCKTRIDIPWSRFSQQVLALENVAASMKETAQSIKATEWSFRHFRPSLKAYKSPPGRIASRAYSTVSRPGVKHRRSVLHAARLRRSAEKIALEAWRAVAKPQPTKGGERLDPRDRVKRERKAMKAAARAEVDPKYKAKLEREALKAAAEAEAEAQSRKPRITYRRGTDTSQALGLAIKKFYPYDDEESELIRKYHSDTPATLQRFSQTRNPSKTTHQGPLEQPRRITRYLQTDIRIPPAPDQPVNIRLLPVGKASIVRAFFSGQDDRTSELHPLEKLVGRKTAPLAVMRAAALKLLASGEVSLISPREAVRQARQARHRRAVIRRAVIRRAVIRQVLTQTSPPPTSTPPTPRQRRRAMLRHSESSLPPRTPSTPATPPNPLQLHHMLRRQSDRQRRGVLGHSRFRPVFARVRRHLSSRFEAVTATVRVRHHLSSRFEAVTARRLVDSRTDAPRSARDLSADFAAARKLAAAAKLNRIAKAREQHILGLLQRDALPWEHDEGGLRRQMAVWGDEARRGKSVAAGLAGNKQEKDDGGAGSAGGLRRVRRRRAHEWDVQSIFDELSKFGKL